MDLYDEIKDRVDLDDDTQTKIAVAAPLLLIGGLVAATLLRGKHAPLHETAEQLVDGGRALGDKVSRRLHQLVLSNGKKPED